MEKYGFDKVLHGMEARNNIKQITTDRHAEIKKTYEGTISVISLTFHMFAKTFVKSCEKLLKRSQQAF